MEMVKRGNLFPKSSAVEECQPDMGGPSSSANIKATGRCHLDTGGPSTSASSGRKFVERSQPVTGGPSATKRPMLDQASKRPRSLEEPSGTSKKARSSTMGPRPFNEVAKAHLIYGILDQGSEDGRINTDRWRMIKKILSSEILSYCLKNESAPPPTFTDGGRHHTGARLVACSNQVSIDFLKSAVPRLGPVWPDAKIVVLHKDEIPVRPKARVWIPPGPIDMKDVLRLIAVQNPDLPTNGWRVLKADEPSEAGRLVALSLSPESLEPLSRRNHRIFYGMEELHLQMYERDKAPTSGIAGKSEVLALSKLLEKQTCEDPSSDSEEGNITVIEASVRTSDDATPRAD